MFTCSFINILRNSSNSIPFYSFQMLGKYYNNLFHNTNTRFYRYHIYKIILIKKFVPVPYVFFISPFSVVNFNVPSYIMQVSLP